MDRDMNKEYSSFTMHLTSLRLFHVFFICILFPAFITACGNATDSGYSSVSGTGGGTGGGTTPPPTPITGAPYILYTNVLTGPNVGGENSKGIYLSVFGKNFGNSGLGTTVKVFINNVEVDNYRYLGPALGRSDIQQITVQIGAIGNPT